MRRAYAVNGWDVLSLAMLTLTLSRHALEYDFRRGLMYTTVLAIFLILHILSDKIRARPYSKLLNISTLVIAAAYPFLQPLLTFRTISAAPVYGLIAISGIILFRRIWQYLEQPPHISNDRLSTHESKSFLQFILCQDALPPALSVWRLVPVGIIGIIIYGIALALPVGPLLDEGMVLFMEGGCDWGESNVFFFSKLGLLLTVNAALLCAMRDKLTKFSLFIPHFVAGAVLIAIWWNDTSCDQYYGHPQGNLAQMVFEIMTVAILMISVIPLLNAQSPFKKLLVLIGINLWYIAAFEFALMYFPHWTWSHSFLVALLMLIPCLGIRLRGANLLPKPSI